MLAYQSNGIEKKNQMQKKNLSMRRQCHVGRPFGKFDASGDIIAQIFGKSRSRNVRGVAGCGEFWGCVRIRRGAVVIEDCTAERSMPVPYVWVGKMGKPPRFGGNGAVKVIIPGRFSSECPCAVLHTHGPAQT